MIGVILAFIPALDAQKRTGVLGSDYESLLLPDESSLERHSFMSLLNTQEYSLHHNMKPLIVQGIFLN